MSKILLIEDEAAIRRTLTVSLMQEGYEVEPCEDGVSGLEKLNNYDMQKRNLGAVILDMMLPDIHGLKILGLIKEKHPELPVILITGFGDHAIEDEVKSKKGDLYLEKPIQMDRLDSYLSDVLREGRQSPPGGRDAAVSCSGYLFIRLNEEEDFVSTFKELYFDSNVMYCDAVRGAFDVIILAHGKTEEELKHFVDRTMNNKGIADAIFSPVHKPIISNDLARVMSEMERFLIKAERNKDESGVSSNQMCSAYALIEVEPERFEQVYKNLYFLDSVVSCDTMKSPYQILLLLKAPQYSLLDEMITRRIARMDGVLRVHQCNIIKIFEM